MSYIVKEPRLADFRGRSKPRKKSERRFVDEDHLRFIRTLPCLCSDFCHKSTAHHLLVLPDNSRGGAMKAGDQWSIPLCHFHHKTLHGIGELRFLNGTYGIHGPSIAALLYQISGNETACLRAIEEIRLLTPTPPTDTGG